MVGSVEPTAYLMGCLHHPKAQFQSSSRSLSSNKQADEALSPSATSPCLPSCLTWRAAQGGHPSMEPGLDATKCILMA